MNIPDKGSYQYIFDQRGKWYHQAMELIPDVRIKEFQLLFEGISFKPGIQVLDFPSGGGYLKKYLPDYVNVNELEVSESFAKIHNISLGKWDSLPFPDKSIDNIFCCAALHHVSNESREKYFEDSYRILTEDGILSLADADINEPVAFFLNNFVNENNSMGHHGDFLTEKSAEKFAKNNFEIIRNEVCRYNWYLTGEIPGSLKFFKLMFGLDKCDDKELLNEISGKFNLRKNENNRYIIDWSLRYIMLKKK